MSMDFGGYNGMAIAIKEDEFGKLFGIDPYDYDLDVIGEGNCCSFYAAGGDDYGKAVTGERKGIYYRAPELMVLAYPTKAPDYFKAVYENVDDVLDDIIKNSSPVFDGVDRQYLKDHLVDISIVTFG